MKLSIITVNLNNYTGLQRTLKSVAGQFYKDFEHIIIDGGSTDGSKEYLEANTDLFTNYISELDVGIYDAMNKGAALAKADYLYFLNSGDDLEGKTALKNIVAYLNGEDLIYFDINVIDGVLTNIKKAPAKLSFRYIYDDLPAHQATFVKRSLFERLNGYDASLKIVADWKFFALAVLKYDASHKYVPTTFSNFYTGGISSIEKNRKALENERKLILEKEFPILLEDIRHQFKLQRILRNLRKSKKIQWLQRLGLLDKF
ncbi:Glycosyltransferase involved in cell wall bisynthesis [Nonlabens sp. Hel1_33_55]|uniref:glycosyltransferase family 2 protein n=1 Tax=Nonlabens sp. Hel1_33_55 TaxID=1336802 RepID=UPI000875B9BE|nr:glycosyltransferase family 2 protein [Nonlabens sp. Hel1_33_55]SCX92208.1 Glycosyltransferase involved in cell wall bisynthesis [Nonlabens sp. Hel1_33_55]